MTRQSMNGAEPILAIKWWSISVAQREAAARLVVGCYHLMQARGLFKQLGLNRDHWQDWLRLLPPAARREPLSRPGVDQLLQALEISRTMSKAEQHSLTGTGHGQPASYHWKRGDRVRHLLYGTGKITTVSRMTGETWVQFDANQIPRTVKSIDLEFA